MKARGSSPLGKVADLGPLVLRLGVGLVFVVHGWQKFDNGVAGFASYLESLDVPLPDLTAWLVTAAEAVGGVLLILGLFTRFATVPLVAVMVGAILMVKVDVGFVVAEATGAELDTALLAGLLGLLFIGPGRYSVDSVIGLETSAVPDRHDQARASV